MSKRHCSSCKKNSKLVIMNVVIFGGTGFLGSWIAKKLIDNDINVTIFDKKIDKNLIIKLIKNYSSKLTFYEGNILNFQKVLDVSKKANVLINLVGLMTPDCSQNPILGAKINIMGSINVFEAALNTKNKYVIYTSSGGVFGRNDPVYPLPETHYGAYKLALEGIARAYFLERNFNSFGLRPFIVYGPGREIGGTAGISQACKASANNSDFEIQFSGKAGFVYVEDISELVFKVLKNYFHGANVMNINGISCEVDEIVTILNKFNVSGKITSNKKKLPVIGEILGNGPKTYFPDFEFTGIETGLIKTLDFYRN